jgi:signal transduction histidine kinase
MRRGSVAIAGVSAVAAVAVVGVVWLDALFTRRELVGLLREQAAALRQTVAAAARSNEAAGSVAEAQLAARLLDNARYLRELERRGALTEKAIEEVADRSRLFRVSVVPAGGGPGPGPPAGAPGMGGRHGRGGGRGPGPFGGGGLARRLLEGEPEAVTDVHAPRFGAGERLAAGVRTERGGAIIVTVDAGAVAALQRPASLNALLEDVTRSAGAIAYTVLEAGDQRLAHGELPSAGAAPATGERELEVGGRPVIEFAGPVPLAGGRAGVLRLGMRLDGVRAAERRMLLRLAASALAASLLVALAFGTLRWRERYGALSARHARAEEALRRRDRLAAVGEAAGTVAHEIRNPLNAIAMSVQRVRREFVDAAPLDEAARSEARELLSVMEAETRRMNRTVQQFLDFARPPRLAPQPTELASLVAGLVESRRPLAEARAIALDADAAAAGRANVDPDQLRQALDNILRNALEATPAGGRVTVKAGSTAREDVIAVADTGPGIPADQIGRVFDLYFTTKAEGTGVGLAITQQIVTAHGGTVEVDSPPGGGTRFTVRLPRAGGMAGA